jgi:putative ABC transport system permease protein
MFKHLLKLIWNRKSSHGLIITEITIAFLVLFGVASFGYHNWHIYHQPMGFSWENGLHIMIRNGGDWTETDGENLEQAINVLRSKPEIESANAVVFGPFRGWRSRSNYEYGDKDVQVIQNKFTDNTYEDLGMELVQGRWTGPEDYGLAWDSVVINQHLATELFINESPLGQNICPPDDENDNYRECRIVGVFSDFRQMGEFSELGNYLIRRFPIEDHKQRSFSLLVFPQPGSPISVQEDIQDTIQRVAPGWTISIKELSEMREDMIQQVMTPMSIMILIAIFLIIMVGFGLFGVLWQSVTRRTSELGLRRAMGANRKQIYRQIVAEMCLGAGIALSIGIFIAVQFPMLGTFEFVDWTSATGGILISACIVITLCFLCALYPGWLASRRSPAEALHYE